MSLKRYPTAIDTLIELQVGRTYFHRILNRSWSHTQTLVQRLWLASQTFSGVKLSALLYSAELQTRTPFRNLERRSSKCGSGVDFHPIRCLNTSSGQARIAAFPISSRLTTPAKFSRHS